MLSYSSGMNFDYSNIGNIISTLLILRRFATYLRTLRPRGLHTMFLKYHVCLENISFGNKCLVILSLTKKMWLDIVFMWLEIGSSNYQIASLQSFVCRYLILPTVPVVLVPIISLSQFSTKIKNYSGFTASTLTHWTHRYYLRTPPTSDRAWYWWYLREFILL